MVRKSRWKDYDIGESIKVCYKRLTYSSTTYSQKSTIISKKHTYEDDMNTKISSTTYYLSDGSKLICYPLSNKRYHYIGGVWRIKIHRVIKCKQNEKYDYKT